MNRTEHRERMIKMRIIKDMIFDKNAGTKRFKNITQPLFPNAIGALQVIALHEKKQQQSLGDCINNIFNQILFLKAISEIHPLKLVKMHQRKALSFTKISYKHLKIMQTLLSNHLKLNHSELLQQKVYLATSAINLKKNLYRKHKIQQKYNQQLNERREIVEHSSTENIQLHGILYLLRASLFIAVYMIKTDLCKIYLKDGMNLKKVGLYLKRISWVVIIPLLLFMWKHIILDKKRKLSKIKSAYQKRRRL